MKNTIICPVSSERIDSNVSRLTAFLKVKLMVGFLITLEQALWIVVGVDYFIRAIGYNKYSPIAFISSKLAGLLSWKVKLVDKAPKMFASRLGFFCAALGFIFIMLELPIASISVIAMFVVLASLDSLANYCVGCLIYHKLVFPYFGKD